MQVTYQLTQEDFYQGCLAWRSRRKWQLWMLRIAYVIVGIAFLTSLLTLLLDRSSMTAPTALAGLAFCVVWFAYVLLTPRFSSRRQFRSMPSVQSPITLDITEAGLEIHTIHAESKVSWAAYVGWVERKTVFVILPQPRIYVPIPKRAFNEEQIEEFRELLRRTVKAG